MADINRFFEYIDKEEIIKKIVSLEFGKFLAYYADAPELEVVTKEERRKSREQTGQSDRQKRMNKAQEGYHRLFINLGKRDGFYPGELMQTLNRYVGGRQEVGHIDLLDTISYFEVPEKDARKVMTQLSGIRYHGRIVRCNSEDNKAERPEGRKEKAGREYKRNESRDGNRKDNRRKPYPKNDFNPRQKQFDLRGPEPDFSEEGWARRRPKKRK
jgi:ATP-dependent RNA helicase DeaD